MLKSVLTPILSLLIVMGAMTIHLVAYGPDEIWGILTIMLAMLGGVGIGAWTGEIVGMVKAVGTPRTRKAIRERGVQTRVS